MVDFAIYAGFVFVFSIWIQYQMIKFKTNITALIEESNKKATKHIDTKIKEFKAELKEKKASPGKEFYYEG